MARGRRREGQEHPHAQMSEATFMPDKGVVTLEARRDYHGRGLSRVRMGERVNVPVEEAKKLLKDHESNPCFDVVEASDEDAKALAAPENKAIQAPKVK